MPINYNEDVNQDLLNLIKYINPNQPCDNLTQDINDCINVINKKNRDALMNWQQPIDEVNEYFKNEGIKEGSEQGKLEGIK